MNTYYFNIVATLPVLNEKQNRNEIGGGLNFYIIFEKCIRHITILEIKN